MTMLLSLALAMLVGLLFTRLAKLVHLPNVTAYLVAGLLIGPSCLGLVPSGVLKSMDIISTVALGFIAFSIGGEFKLSSMKMLGSRVITITFFQAMTAVLMVDAVLLICGFPAAEALTLGAIAAATAPAATLMVVRQYRAKGPLTSTLLPVVAMDDAVGLIVFAISFGIAKALENGHMDLVSVIADPLIEVFASLVLGAVLGYLFHFTEQFFYSRSKRMSISVTYVLLAVALSQLTFRIGAVTVGFSSLLVCMALGTVFCNLCPFSAELMDRVDRWTGPLMVLFFVLSGAGLDFDVFSDPAIILVGVVYILFRSIGKISGAAVSSKFMHCEPTVQKYLGITLLPQAGVSLGMSLTAMSLGAPGLIIRNVALFAVLVYELVGPLLTRIALDKAGEIPAKPITEREAAKSAK